MVIGVEIVAADLLRTSVFSVYGDKEQIDFMLLRAMMQVRLCDIVAKSTHIELDSIEAPELSEPIRFYQ